jgi:hypothetical protein
MTQTSTTLESSFGTELINRIRSASPLIWWTVIGMLALSVICVGLQWADPRLINGANVWHKPAKFFSSLAIQFATVGWGLSLLPTGEQARRRMHWFITAMVAAGWLEMAYIVFRASRAEASHFNRSSLTADVLYSLMGLGAVFMMVAAGYVGYRLWRNRSGSLLKESVALGLMIGAVLGGVAGAYMSSQYGHSVGGDPTDATGTGFFGWSTTGGDLRIAHFVGLHAAQIIPLAAFTGSRSVMWLSALFCIIVTVGTLILAASGVPLFGMNPS